MTFDELTKQLSNEMHKLRCKYPDMFIVLGDSIDVPYAEKVEHDAILFVHRLIHYRIKWVKC